MAEVSQYLVRCHLNAGIVTSTPSTVSPLASKAWAIGEELRQADPARVRQLLRQAVERIELSFTAARQGKRQIYLATGGKLFFRELSGFDSRGDCPSFEPCLPEYVDILLGPDPYLRQSDRLTRQCA